MQTWIILEIPFAVKLRADFLKDEVIWQGAVFLQADRVHHLYFTFVGQSKER